MENGFLVIGRNLCLLLLLSVRVCLVYIYTGLEQVVIFSWNSFVHQSYCIWKTLFFWSHPPLLTLKILLLPLLYRSLSI